MYNFRTEGQDTSAPYSTDMSINDYTYADIDEALSVPHVQVLFGRL
jgi:hypothetical protein